ncbi:MAG: cytochrome b/b6 domain-containing protein [Spirulinaceae cyanobacterium]
MPRSQPYQPLLLRILHGVVAVVALGAIITSYWVYDLFDGRWLKLSLPNVNGMIGIHGTFGLTLLLIMPLFAIYAFYIGHKRLVQPDSFAKSLQFNKPISAYSFHRIVNTLMLIAVTWALITGRLMQEKWLPSGDLDIIWYSLHLSSWVLLVLCLIAHIVMGLKVGGQRLMLSMVALKVRPDDTPPMWWQKFKAWQNQQGKKS